MGKLDNLIWAFLAAMLVFSGIDKLVHYQGFINAINDYRILPLPMGPFLAPLIISAELAIALGLCRSSWRRAAGLHSAVLLLIFTLGWTANWTLGSRGICGCWFSINMVDDEAHLVLNLILIVLSIFVWLSTAKT